MQDTLITIMVIQGGLITLSVFKEYILIGMRLHCILSHDLSLYLVIAIIRFFVIHSLIQLFLQLYPSSSVHVCFEYCWWIKALGYNGEQKQTWQCGGTVRHLIEIHNQTQGLIVTMVSSMKKLKRPEKEGLDLLWE